MESGLKLYSIGIVVETKPPGVDYILVTPIEELNIQAPGSIKDAKKEFKGNKKELESTNFKTEHEAKPYLRAKWLPFGQSNRISAPDVVANETVILFKFGNVDEIYWTTMFREPELRRQEDVLFALSNLPKGMVAFDRESSYWMQWSTVDKFVHLHTAMNDKEHTTYDIKLDTKTGTLNIKDGKGNDILLHSPSNTLTVTTKNKVDINAENEVNVKTKVANITADTSTTIKSPTINLIGNTNIDGNLVTKGKTTAQGGMDSGGSVTVKGDVTASGKVLDAGGNSNHHSH